VTGSLGFQSQYTSPATGQVDMGARWYNPATGSFGNKDTVSNKPVPDSASASPFGYAADNPLGIADPSGHMPVVPPGDPNSQSDQKALLAQYAAQQKATAAARAKAVAAQAKAVAAQAAAAKKAAQQAAAKKAAQQAQAKKVAATVKASCGAFLSFAGCAQTLRGATVLAPTPAQRAADTTAAKVETAQATKAAAVSRPPVKKPAAKTAAPVDSKPAYVPITPHFLVQTSDPYYGSMVRAYKAYLNMNGVSHPSTITQETSLWYEVCVVGGHGNTCPQNLTVTLNTLFNSVSPSVGDSAEAESIHSDTVFLAGKDLAGGAIETSVSDIVSLYKAPQKGMTQKILQEGFKVEDFPGGPGDVFDGNAYFAIGERGKQIASEKYAPFGTYDGTVIRVDIPRTDFDQHFPRPKSLDGEPNIEVAIPNTMFDRLNQYPVAQVSGDAGGGDG
jgi:RHS repeat-associated protein